MVILFLEGAEGGRGHLGLSAGMGAMGGRIWGVVLGSEGEAVHIPDIAASPSLRVFVTISLYNRPHRPLSPMSMMAVRVWGPQLFVSCPMRSFLHSHPHILALKVFRSCRCCCFFFFFAVHIHPVAPLLRAVNGQPCLTRVRPGSRLICQWFWVGWWGRWEGERGWWWKGGLWIWNVTGLL